MRRAMAEAEVGDDVYGEDPTVNRLEQRAAEILGKEAALFVPTGTMGNTIGIKVNTNHGEEVVCDDRAHILDWELSMTAWFSGCLVRTVPTADGILRWRDIEPAVAARADRITRRHRWCIWSIRTTWAAARCIRWKRSIRFATTRMRAGVRVHMDGARLFNAVAASGVAAARIAAKVDTVMFCLSKGLGAPAGSMLAGSSGGDRARARLYRKRLGGGMRQAGVLAAAGLIALEEMPDTAMRGSRQREIPGGGSGRATRSCDRSSQGRHQHCDLRHRRIGHRPEAFEAASEGSRSASGGRRRNADGRVTHLDVSRKDCERALAALASILT